MVYFTSGNDYGRGGSETTERVVLARLCVNYTGDNDGRLKLGRLLEPEPEVDNG